MSKQMDASSELRKLKNTSGQCLFCDEYWFVDCDCGRAKQPVFDTIEKLHLESARRCLP